MIANIDYNTRQRRRWIREVSEYQRELEKVLAFFYIIKLAWHNLTHEHDEPMATGK